MRAEWEEVKLEEQSEQGFKEACCCHGYGNQSDSDLQGEALDAEKLEPEGGIFLKDAPEMLAAGQVFETRCLLCSWKK